MFKKLLVLVLSVFYLVCSSSFTFALDNNNFSGNITESTMSTDKEIYDIIMNIENITDRDKVYEFWYTPAYSITETSDVYDDLQSNSLTGSDCSDSKALNIVNTLSKLTSVELDKAIAQFVNIGAERIIEMDNVEITDDYLAYAKKYLTSSNQESIQCKKNDYVEVSLDDISITPVSDTKSTTTNKKQFKKTYGNSSTFSYCEFYTTVTWKTSGGKITSISSSNTGIKTPSHISTTALQRNKTYRSSTNKTGYVQKGWGYVNFYYGGTGLTGYYVLDIKVYGSNSSKFRGETITPQRWSSYNWGDF